MKILINAIIAKRRSGGGFQVCINFIKKTLEYKGVEWYYFVSDELDLALGNTFSDYKDKLYFSFPTQPDFLSSYWKVRKKVSKLEMSIKPDVIFSILAPSYFSFQSTEVMRYTFPWVTNSNRLAWQSLPLKKCIRIKLYCLLQKFLIRKTRYFVTQSTTSAEGILKFTKLPAENVIVVPNVLPEVFAKYDVTHIESENINIICVGSAYYHKNIEIVPDVLNNLILLGYKNVRFHITLPPQSTLYKVVINKAKKYGVLNYIINHGLLTQLELGDVYRLCDYSFIPSLMEVFSASTVEAMHFGLPVVATKFGFNFDVFGDSCLYYEPLNAVDAAMQFQKLIEDKNLRDECRVKMKEYLIQYYDFNSYFRDTLSFICKTIENTNKE